MWFFHYEPCWWRPAFPNTTYKWLRNNSLRSALPLYQNNKMHLNISLHHILKAEAKSAICRFLFWARSSSYFFRLLPFFMLCSRDDIYRWDRKAIIPQKGGKQDLCGNISSTVTCGWWILHAVSNYTLPLSSCRLPRPQFPFPGFTWTGTLASGEWQVILF